MTKTTLRLEESSAKKNLRKRNNGKKDSIIKRFTVKSKDIEKSMESSQKMRYKALKALLATAKTALAIIQGSAFIVGIISVLVIFVLLLFVAILVTAGASVAILASEGSIGVGGGSSNPSQEAVDCKNSADEYIEACERVWQNFRSKNYDYSWTAVSDADYGIVRPDCSGYVYATLQEYGLLPKPSTTAPFNTGSMGDVIMGTGKFDELDYNGDIGMLKKGDICVEPTSHTQVFVSQTQWYNLGSEGHLKNPTAYDASWFAPSIVKVYRIKQEECKDKGGSVDWDCPEGGLPMPLYIQTQYPQMIGNSGSSIAEGGCGYTSLAMVISYLKGEKIEPTDIINKVGDSYHTNVGISWSGFTEIPALYGITGVNQVSSIDEVCKALKEGHPVICSQGAGIFTTEGHIIALRGITKDGKILVNDPNDNKNKNFADRQFDPSEISASALGFWIFPKK